MTVVAIRSSAKCQLISITGLIQQLVEESGIDNGVCVVCVPHTTAGIMINENADPDVCFDILTHLDRLVPAVSDYRHVEGNSAAHIKASLIGSSVTVIVEDGELVLGRWQDIFFAEFDGPRQRSVYAKVVGSPR
jgi:secondary thiamine-phosphate synthase enzyme